MSHIAKEAEAIERDYRSTRDLPEKPGTRSWLKRRSKCFQGTIPEWSHMSREAEGPVAERLKKAISKRPENTRSVEENDEESDLEEQNQPWLED